MVSALGCNAVDTQFKPPNCLSNFFWGRKNILLRQTIKTFFFWWHLVAFSAMSSRLNITTYFHDELIQTLQNNSSFLFGTLYSSLTQPRAWTEIRPANFRRTSLIRYQLSCPDWIQTIKRRRRATRFHSEDFKWLKTSRGWRLQGVEDFKWLERKMNDSHIYVTEVSDFKLQMRILIKAFRSFCFPKDWIIKCVCLHFVYISVWPLGELATFALCQLSAL